MDIIRRGFVADFTTSVPLRFDASSFAIASAFAALVPIAIHLMNRRRFKIVDWAATDFLREALQRQRQVLRLRDLLVLTLRVAAVLMFGLALSRPLMGGHTSDSWWSAIALTISLAGAVGCAVGWAASSKSRRGWSLIGFFASATMTTCLLIGIARDSSGQNPAVAARVPVHAVLLVDNSGSLGVESLGITLLDRVKTAAAAFMTRLPLESRITVIPLASSEDAITHDAFRNKIDALQALEQLMLVDAGANMRTGIMLAEQACRKTTDPPEKRVVLFTDGQANAWEGLTSEDLQRCPGLQIVNVSTGLARNVWVTDFQIEDGLASVDVPCHFRARVHANSVETTADLASNLQPFEVQAQLWIDGVEVASQSIELTAGQQREVEFTHQFDSVTAGSQPGWVVAKVNVRTDQTFMDQLPRDNQQLLVVPLVSSIPVVFVDQYGDEETVEQNLIGETYALRHLLAPRSAVDKTARQLIDIEHVRADQVTQELLQAARLVVVAGIEAPDSSLVSRLREFVIQGGPVVLLAGGKFDSAAWTRQAWLDGRGILPAPLDAVPLGQTPEEATEQVSPFYADFSSMQHDFFRIDGEDDRILKSLFESTPFFKAVAIDLSAQMLSDLANSDRNRIAEEQQLVDLFAAGKLNRESSTTSPAMTDDDLQTFSRLEPTWWRWRSPLPLTDRTHSPAELARQAQPRALAYFQGHQRPFAVERHLGAGRVVLFASGVSSNWNMLRSSAAMYLFHRAFFQLIDQTFPTRTVSTGRSISLPVERQSEVTYYVNGPSGRRERLPIDVVSTSVYGVTIRRPLVAGTYRIESERLGPSSDATTATRLDEFSFAVNGPVSESDLTMLTNQELRQRCGSADVRVLSIDEPLRWELTTRHGYSLWKLCGWCVLGCLLAEQILLTWPKLLPQCAGVFIKTD